MMADFILPNQVYINFITSNDLIERHKAGKESVYLPGSDQILEPGHLFGVRGDQVV